MAHAPSSASVDRGGADVESHVGGCCFRTPNRAAVLKVMGRTSRASPTCWTFLRLAFGREDRSAPYSAPPHGIDIRASRRGRFEKDRLLGHPGSSRPIRIDSAASAR